MFITSKYGLRQIDFPHLLRVCASSPSVHFGPTSDILSESEDGCAPGSAGHPLPLCPYLRADSWKNTLGLLCSLSGHLFLLQCCGLCVSQLEPSRACFKEKALCLFAKEFRNISFQDEQLCSKCIYSAALALKLK